MAFDRTGLCRIGGSGTGGSTWQYSTADATTTVTGTDYFVDAIDEIALGDIMLLVGTTGTTPTGRISIVKARSATSIDLASGIAVSDA